MKGLRRRGIGKGGREGVRSRIKANKEVGGREQRVGEMGDI